MSSEDDAESVLDQLKSLLTFCKYVDTGKIINKEEKQVKIESNIEHLEALTRRVSILGMFSDNEELCEVQTGHISFMLLPAMLGFLHESMPNPKDRIHSLKLAKAYYRDYFDRVHKYGVLTKKMKLGHIIDDTVEQTIINSDKDGKDIDKLQRRRDEKIARYRLQTEMGEKFNKLENMGANADDEDLRELYITQLKHWAYKSAEAYEGIIRELDMLAKFGSLGHEGKAASTSHNVQIQPPQAIQPFIITRNALQKHVYGAGYPSLPVMTVEEWAAQKFKDDSKVQSNAPGDGLGEGDTPVHSDEEENVMKMREQDEYKDTHRRGWGNTHNKG